MNQAIKTKELTTTTTTVDCEEMTKLLEDFYNIHQIQDSLYTILKKHGNRLDTVSENMEIIKKNEIEGLHEVTMAKKYLFRYTPILIGSFLGICLTGPPGILFGFKMGSIITGLGGGMIGGWCGYKLQK